MTDRPGKRDLASQLGGSSDEPLLSGIVPYLDELAGNNDVVIYLDEIRAAIAALPRLTDSASTVTDRFDPGWKQPEPRT